MRLLFLLVLISGTLQIQAQQKKEYTDFDRGYYHFYYQKWDSAYIYFDRYLKKNNDPLERAKTYSYIGEIQKNTGDLFGAQETLLNAMQRLDPLVDSQRLQWSIINTVLGNISLDLRRYDEAISFFNTALHHLPAGSEYGSEIINSKTIALQRKGDYPSAVALYDSILGLPQKYHVRLARLIHNRARTKWLENKNYNPLPEFYKALKIRLDSNFSIGLNASYAHIADYYESSNKDSSLWYANKMYEVATRNQSAEDRLEAIDKLIKFEHSANEKLKWYSEYKRLDDSLSMVKDTVRTRFALIRYGEQKNKADNFRLQRQIDKQQYGMYALISLAAIIITGVGLFYNRRRKRMQQESENAIKEARMRTSQKVHDVVANGLYGIMNELEHKETIEREPLIERIEGLYEKSRNISYEDLSSTITSNYEISIGNMLSTFASEHTKVISVGNKPEFWEKLSTHQRQQLDLVLNELMVNMKKHSGAKNVVIQFAEEPGRALVRYKDDGVGLSADHESGNGLKNTVNRISEMRGEVIFGKSEKGGLRVDIILPLTHPTT